MSILMDAGGGVCRGAQGGGGGGDDTTAHGRCSFTNDYYYSSLPGPRRCRQKPEAY